MVPLAAPGLYFVSVREKPSAETPFQTVRVYLKRLPSGAYRVTVLSPSLPRPVFRMYPAGTSEAEAVARAVGRALSLGDANTEQECHRRDETCLNPVATCANDVAKDKGHQHCGKSSHLPPPFPCGGQQTADSQHGAEQHEVSPVELATHSCDEVMQHGLVLHFGEALNKNACPQPNVDSVDPACLERRIDNEKQEHRAGENLTPVAFKDPTQHRRPPLRLRVLWQGLLG